MLYDRRLLAYKDSAHTYDKLNLVERQCEYQRDIRDIERKLSVCNQILRKPTHPIRDRRPWLDKQIRLKQSGVERERETILKDVYTAQKKAEEKEKQDQIQKDQERGLVRAQAPKEEEKPKAVEPEPVVESARKGSRRESTSKKKERSGVSWDSQSKKKERSGVSWNSQSKKKERSGVSDSRRWGKLKLKAMRIQEDCG